MQNITQIDQLKEQVENLVFRECKIGKDLNMDVDGLQKQLQEYDYALNHIEQLSRAEAAEVERRWNFYNMSSIPLDLDNDDQSNAIRAQMDHYQQKISKLEIDLKREKEFRHVKYYRNDKKEAELKRLHKEKDTLLERCNQYESMIYSLEEQHAKAVNDNQQLSNDLQTKINECKELMTKYGELPQKRPTKLKPKHLARINELESEIDELKQLIKSFEMVSKNNSMSDSAKDVLEKLSVMLLHKNTDPDFFSENQKTLIRTLFGDYATHTYKDKIKELENAVEKHKKTKNDALKETKGLTERSLYYINMICKVLDKLAKETNTLDQYTYSRFLPSKDSLVDDKINLVERMNELEKSLSHETINEGHTLPDFCKSNSKPS